MKLFRFAKAGAMPDSPASSGLAFAYGQLLNVLADSPHLEAFLHKVASLSADTVEPAAACGITMRRDGQPFTVATSADLAAQVDEIQYGEGQGPCLDALSTSAIVQVDDLPADPRWERYRAHAVAHGVISSLSLPLAVDGQTFAAMNLYSTRRAAFQGQPRQYAETFAAQCSAALALILRQADQAETQQQLGEAMASRSIIDQAIGILMGQQRCTATVAFDLLRQASQHRNRKLREIATEIITNVTGEPPQAPADFRTAPKAPRRSP